MNNIPFLPKINILRPTVFPFDKIASGITLTNYHLFQNGFSIRNLDNIEQKTNNEQNKQILSNSIGTNTKKLVFQKQIHSNIVQVVNNNSQNDLIESDGMITAKKNIVLCVSLADCIGVLCYEPKACVIGAFHSGWRGTKSQIVREGITIMKEKFNANPQDMLVYISPAAGKEKYEIGEDVAQYFSAYVKSIGGGKYLLDLRSAIVKQLSDIGINTENNVEVSTGCTITNNNYHSFRRDGEDAGRMTAFIMMQ